MEEPIVKFLRRYKRQIYTNQRQLLQLLVTAHIEADGFEKGLIVVHIE